jgi:hypothetical protein
MGLGILLAFYAGNYVAEENYTPIAAVLGFLVILSAVFGLGASIYLLIPLCWELTGQIPILPLPFSVRQLVLVLASGVFIFGFIFKVNREKSRLKPIDIWIWVNIIYLIITFIRNPVGFAAIANGERVGGKPYVDVVLGIMGYLMLSRFKISAKLSRKIPMIVLCTVLFNGIAGAVQMFLPALGAYLGKFYSLFAADASAGIGEFSINETRFGFLQKLGIILILTIVSRVSPLRLISVNHLGSLIIYILGYIMIFLSGFRNALVSSILYSLISTFLRDRFVGVVRLGALAFVLAVLGILMTFTNIQVPLTFQRALCFLPGNWDEDAVINARNSSEWRVEMWKQALTTDKYIHNKLLGDGFGYLRADYERTVGILTGSIQVGNGAEAQMEMFLLDGDYHSGPVGTIRFVGYFGLVLLLPLFYLMIRVAIRLIGNARGTEFEFCAYFYGLQAIILPFFFFFVVGDYRQDLVTTFFFVGMMKMLNKSIEAARKA